MNGLLQLVRRGVAIGLVFAVARTTVALGLAGAVSSQALPALGVEIAAGLVVGLWLAFVAEHVAGSTARASLAMTALLFVNLLAVMIEGAAYQPTAATPSPFLWSALLQLIVSAAVALTTVGLARARRPREEKPTIPDRTALGWFARYLGCVLTYVVLYFVTGAINFTLITGPYYRSATAGLVVPPAGTVLLVSIAEGALFPLALLPLLWSMRRPSHRRALIAGASLAILGGVVPLILAPSLPLIVRVASAVEILFQKLPAGVAAASLLGPEDARRDSRRP